MNPRPSLYLATARHLKPGQLLHFITRRAKPRTRLRPFPETVRTRKTVGFAKGVAPRCSCSDEMEFTFLGLTKKFGPDVMDWASPEMPKLWRYNLHYFDYLSNEGLSDRSKSWLISDWMEQNGAGRGDGWEPFPVSLRIVNWIKFFLRQGECGREETWLQSLYQQALWLEKNVEYDLLANHYFKDGKALFFAGVFFEDGCASRWLEKGLAIVTQELEEQILPDGGHFERSLMYHSMILEDCIDMMNLCSGSDDERLVDLKKRLRSTAHKMLLFQSGMAHPDGRIPLFNDSAFGVEAGPSELRDYYERVTGETVERKEALLHSFSDTGYFVMSPRPDDRLIIDCGPIGPDYQPGHSHCDTLSFELSLGGKRVIVDSGCYGYEDGSIRQYNRGNMGHNSLTVDGRNQSEVWGAHRCAERAYPTPIEFAQLPDGSLVFKGSHDGYRRLRGKPIHSRQITWRGDSLLIEDTVEGSGVHDIELRLHLHPDIAAHASDGVVSADLGGPGLLSIEANGPGRLEQDSGFYCSQFNSARQCAVVRNRLSNINLPFKGGWVLRLKSR